jgi:hypothetical protein
MSRKRGDLFTLEVTMLNARFRVMAGLAGATLCLFAVTSYAQTPATTGTGADANAQTTPAPTTTPTDPATTQTTTDQVTTTTSTETWSFPGGTLGILAVAVLVLLVLFALFRGRDSTTVVKESYTAPPVTRSSGIGTADDRNINSRAASGPGTNSGGMNDPNARR